ncbi:accelerated cell death 11 [Phalaenopsis equestris]|uniref:accelerated cell death 11 n=1 Tax=Phalaenopsis equestris TaxID=78828 RepID=UPI0009E1E64A|nr:accelerated cell death 11 [Phalaenopsis equestris]
MASSLLGNGGSKRARGEIKPWKVLHLWRPKRTSRAFDGLAETVNSKSVPIESVNFSDACSRVSVLFGCLGIAFKFAERDYVSKVEDLKEAAKSISTLQSMLELDIRTDCVRQGGSHSRNLLRVKRGIDMVKVLFEEILVADGNSLKDPASIAYSKVFAPHHGWAIRKAVAAGMYALPSRSQLLKKLNEDEESARVQMQKYITSSGPVIRYVEELFLARELGIDW